MSRKQPDDLAREAMIERIVAADFGEGPVQDRSSLSRHIGGSPDRAALHASVMTLWDELGRIDPPPLSSDLAADGRTSFAHFLSRRWAMAAAILPVAIAAGLLLHLAGLWAPGGAHEIRTASDERRIVALSDGSTVSLSADTVLTVDIGGDGRRLHLQKGEALFDVAPDPRRPFLVDVGAGSVQAIGTAFNIRIADEAIVTVVEGTVRVTAVSAAGTGGALQLSQIATAGQQVRLGERRDEEDSASYVTPARPIDAGRVASWADGVLRFEGEPLAEVIAELNRYTANDVALTDPGIADTPIYGILHIGDVEGLRSIVRDIEKMDEGAVQRKLVTTADTDG